MVDGPNEVKIALELNLWFQLRTDWKLFVWQGVFALRHKSTSRTWLLKIRKGYSRKFEKILLANCPDNLTLTSDGYWTCAEITGFLHPGDYEFYYHCSSPTEGAAMLKIAKKYAKVLSRDPYLDWRLVGLKVDLDPFRIRTCKEKVQQENDWIRMLKRCQISDFTLTDADMLSYDYQ